MSPELTSILAEVRAQIARGDEPNRDAVEVRIRALPDHDAALSQLSRLLAVHRAKRSLAAPAPSPPPPPVRRAAVYRAKPTIAATMPVRARAADDVVVLEWEPRTGVTQWEARVSERPDARSAYPDGERHALDAPRIELQLGEQPKRVHIAGRNAAGRVVARALVSGLTSTNWNQRWLQRPTAS